MRPALVAALLGAVTVLAPRVAPAASTRAPADPVLVAAGDIACDPHDPAFNHGHGVASRCRQRDVAEVIQTLGPDLVVPLGDTQYDHGERRAYARAYDPSWGRFLDVTFAVVGNHEYETSGADGYYDYFGDAAGHLRRGYHSTDLGTWHIVALNSECWVQSCAKRSPQVRWLKRDLADSHATCTIAAWHEPRWSSGEHGNNPAVGPLVRVLVRRGVDILLVGHDHDYERFTTLAPDGTVDPNGVREFVVGTGGAQLYDIGPPEPHSEVRRHAFGVLALTLHDGSYDWSFERVVSGPGDGGTADCVS